MDIRLCDHGKFEPAFEIVKRQKVGLEFQTFADPRYEFLHRTFEVNT
jgi:hypothetical protein